MNAWLFAIVNVYLSAPGAFVTLAPRLVSTLLAGLRALRAILRPQRPASLVERVARGNPDRNPTALSWRWPR